MPTLAHPLSIQSLHEAFKDLSPSCVLVRSRRGFQDAVVDGAWTLPVLRAHLRSLGLQPIQHTDSLLWSNAAKDVGIQLFGIDRHPHLPAWKTYTIEVQARKNSAARPPAHFP